MPELDLRSTAAATLSNYLFLFLLATTACITSLQSDQRRSISDLAVAMQFASYSFKLQCNFQGRLMLLGALIVGITEADLDEAKVDAGVLGFFYGGHEIHLVAAEA